MIRPRFRHTGRPCCLILLCLLLLPWLGACAPQYGVSVDSLRGPQADSAGTVYVPRPGVEGMAEDDLLFRDVAAQLEPCFTARGYTLKLDGQPQDKSDNLVFISFGISEPDVRIYTTVSYVPYTWGRGHFRHTRWVREEETRTKVFFHAGLLLEGWFAFAARCVCALALLFVGWVCCRWLRKKLFPRLLQRSWHFAFTHPLLESFASPAARIAWYTGIYLALRSLPWAIPGFPALLLKVYRMLLVFLIGTGFYHASGIAALLLASSSEEVRTNRTLLTLLDKAYKIVVVLLCGATIAQESGLPVGSIVASAGLVGLTISLAAQDMAKNFFSGVVILLDKPFSIGDWISVGDVEGEVVDINFRSTKVRALDNSVYILTNSTVSSATINNATLRNKRLYRFTLGVTYDTTRPQLEKLMADLDAMLKASPDTYEDTAFVRMTGFGDSSINLMVSAYLRTADLGAFLRMQNDLNLNIMDVMKADGVDFAFPSTTVYLAKEN